MIKILGVCSLFFCFAKIKGGKPYLCSKTLLSSLLSGFCLYSYNTTGIALARKSNELSVAECDNNVNIYLG